MCFSIPYMKKNYNNAQIELSHVIEGERVIAALDFQSPFDHFILNYDTSVFSNYFGGFSPNDFNNVVIANYYGIEHFIRLPYPLFNDIRMNPEKYIHLATTSQCPSLLAKKILYSDSTRISDVIVRLKPTENVALPFFKDLFNRYLNKNNISEYKARWSCFDFEGNTYLFVKLDDDYFDRTDSVYIMMH